MPDAESRAVSSAYRKAGMLGSAETNASPQQDDGLQHGPGCPCYACTVQDT